MKSDLSGEEREGSGILAWRWGEFSLNERSTPIQRSGSSRNGDSWLGPSWPLCPALGEGPTGEPCPGSVEGGEREQHRPAGRWAAQPTDSSS